LPSTLRRFAAALAGAVTLVVCIPLTLGTILAAPLGVLVARWLARRGQRPLSRGAAWLGAVLGSFLGVALLFTVLLAMAPPGTLTEVRAAMDSSLAKQEPTELPAWLERINPQARQQSAATEQMMSSKGFVTFFGVVGAVFACSMLGTLAGSLGWVASMLISYAIRGRWLPGAIVLPPPLLGEE
jgi:hypothetical protein